MSLHKTFTHYGYTLSETGSQSKGGSRSKNEKKTKEFKLWVKTNLVF